MNKDLQLREKIKQKLVDVKQKLGQDGNRLAFHLTPAVGLLNDPNGLIYFKGKYHVFFQWNPFETKHTFKAWGHVSSQDFIGWEVHPPALVPSEWYEKDGCYSGSAVEYNGKLYLFYTGNVRTEDGGRETYQCLAITEDGICFEKKGPVIELPEGYTTHFRDPKVWQEGEKWYMVLGAQTKSFEGSVVLYSSSDLLHWQLEGPLAGPGITLDDPFGFMWECPDFFLLNEKDVLVCSPQGLESEPYKYQNLYQSGYFIGDWDRKTKKFSHSKFQELDYGFDFYAPQTFTDGKGRRILIAWMGMGDEMEQHHPTVRDGWLHALTIPRELSIKAEKLYQQPIDELKMLRTNYYSEAFTLTNEKIEIGLNSDLQEIIINIDQFEGKKFSLQLPDRWKLTYTREQGIISFERTRFDTHEKETRHCLIESIETIHILQDRSSVEIFLNNGEKVFTSRYYSNNTHHSCVIAVDGSVAMQWQNWDLGSFSFQHHE